MGNAESMRSMANLSTAGLEGRWRTMTETFLASPTGVVLAAKLAAEVANVYPATPFRALELTPFEKVRVVIVGQDPYHTPGKACGLAFSVPEDERLPPSLKNIFRVVAARGGALRQNGDLTDWARQGVLLINPVLTVEEGKPLSHARWGWEKFTAEIFRTLVTERTGLVFLLWGRTAASKVLPYITPSQGHLVIESTHPSPLAASRGEGAFLKSDCFNIANDWLVARGVAPINWVGASES